MLALPPNLSLACPRAFNRCECLTICNLIRVLHLRKDESLPMPSSESTTPPEHMDKLHLRRQPCLVGGLQIMYFTHKRWTSMPDMDPSPRACAQTSSEVEELQVFLDDAVAAGTEVRP